MQTRENEQIAELKALAENFPQAELDLTPYKDVLTDALLKPILINANKHLKKKLVLDGCNKLTNNVPSLIAKHCPKISYISTKNMSWAEWNTRRSFKELEILHMEGCSQLKDVKIIAPKLKNSLDIIKVIHVIKYANWQPDHYYYPNFNLRPFQRYFTLKLYQHEPPIVTLKINKEKIDTDLALENYLTKGLKDNAIDEIALDHWGDPNKFIDTINTNIAENTSLKTLAIKGTSFTSRRIEPMLLVLLKNKALIKLDLSNNTFMHNYDPSRRVGYLADRCRKLVPLLSEHPQLQNLDLSHNYLTLGDSEAIASILSSSTKIKNLNLSNNHLGGDTGLKVLTKGLEKNESLVEINLDDTIPPTCGETYTRKECTLQEYLAGKPTGEHSYRVEYNVLFDNESLIPFFNMLAHQKTLRSLSIAGYLTDQSALALADTLKSNKTLTHISIRQNSYCHGINARLYCYSNRYTFSHRYMTDQGASLLAEGIQSNTTVTSIKLLNVLINVKGFTALADAIEKNIRLTECNIVLFKPVVSDIQDDLYPKLTKNELSAIHVQQARIQSYIERNRRLLAQPQEAVCFPCESKEEKTFQREKSFLTSSQLSLFTKTQQERDTQRDLEQMLLPANLFSFIPEDAPPGLQLEMMRASHNQLVRHVMTMDKKLDSVVVHANTLDKELDRDPESKQEMNRIKENRKLDDYYLKICELVYFIKASQAITTMLVAQRDNAHDIAVKSGAYACEKAVSLLHFIPIVAGFSTLFEVGIDAAEAIAHFNHSIDKDRRAQNLMRFTRGLGVGGDERLIERFARKLTLANQDKILHPESYIDAHLQHSFLEWILKNTKSVVDKGSQVLREHREGHDYSADEKLALADMLKILDAIATGVIFPPSRENVQDPMDQLLETMLDYMKKEEQEKSLACGLASELPRRASC